MYESRKEIEYQITEMGNKLDDADATRFEVTNFPEKNISLRKRLPETVEKGINLGVEEFYSLTRRDEDGEVALAAVYFFYNDRPHIAFLQPEEVREQQEEDTRGREGSNLFSRQESEEEKQRKQEIRTELLEEYEDYLEEPEKYELENRLDRMRLRQLLRIKERVEEEASVDPEEEKRLAKRVYEDDRFNRQFNNTDTEMLLDDLDVEYDPNNIRVEEVHRRAKSLLKINRGRDKSENESEENTGISDF